MGMEKRCCYDIIDQAVKLLAGNIQDQSAYQLADKRIQEDN